MRREILSSRRPCLLKYSSIPGRRGAVSGRKEKAMEEQTIIHISDDFDMDRIADSGQCFRWEKAEPDTYRILAGRSCLYMKALGEDRYVLDCNRKAFEGFWQDYFDLRENYGKIRALIDPEKDPFLFAASRAQKGIRILRQDPWEMLITFIISQNRNIPAIKRSVELLSEACGEKMTDTMGRTYYAFPDPETAASLTEAELKACRLGYRCRYVKAAAQAILEGSIDLPSLADADEDRTLEALTGILGVGVKVASCVSLFGLHHTDAFPVDVWMKRILKERYPEGYPFERYSPYNGIFQQYMFAYYRQRAGEKERLPKEREERGFEG